MPGMIVIDSQEVLSLDLDKTLWSFVIQAYLQDVFFQLHWT